MGYLGLVLGTLVLILIPKLWRLLVQLTWRPYVTTKRFREQGIRGPAYKFLSGSLKEMNNIREASEGVVLDIHCHDISSRVFSHYTKWVSEYGRTFLYWFGPQPSICITDPEMVKQVLSNKFGFYGMEKQKPIIFAMIGKGLVLAEGSDWARHRRLLNPAFTVDKLKMMTKTMAECTQLMIERWQSQAFDDEAQQKEVELSKEFQELTADIISHTAFGSSYKEGKEVFLAQKELMRHAVATFLKVQIPGFQYLPTSRNKQMWKLAKQMRNTLMKIIQARLKFRESGFGNDLLGLMMEACNCTSDYGGQQEHQSMNMDEMIDECKTFFFAGHEGTSHSLTWSMFLLSTNQEWQERLRDEINRECGEDIPDSDSLGKLKLMNMFILETLRLYSPAVMVRRKADKDTILGSLKVPKDTLLSMPFFLIHRDKEIWGADANEFNPLRFANGITKAAKHPNALLSFSIGPRVCIGKNFAMLEAKIVLAMILQKFSFSISPGYIHAPTAILTLQPKYGLPVILRPLNV
ncbi:cytochrome P450 709B2-like [Typha angustifolia]|uniref:cytochrome P450 709B2-like n=1 Tax=Typha angustifolia TaxID=59011 RepID=UPI003C2E405A